jgi:hypothetical protein
MSLPEFAKEWMEQWRAAGPALEEVRARELRELTDEEARAATVDLLDLGIRVPLPRERWQSSGLVIQQELFRRHRPEE